MNNKNEVASLNRERSKSCEHGLRTKEGKKAEVGRLGGLRQEEKAPIYHLVVGKMNFLGKRNRNIVQHVEPL